MKSKLLSIFTASYKKTKTFMLQPNMISFHVSSVQFLELAYSVQFLEFTYSVQFLELVYLHEGGRLSCGYFLVVLNRVTVCSVLVSDFFTFQQVRELFLKLSSLVFVWFRLHLLKTSTLGSFKQLVGIEFQF